MKDIYSQKIIDLLILNKEVNFSSLETERVLAKASKNRVLFEFCSKIIDSQKKNIDFPIKTIIKEGNLYLDKLRKTLLLINDKLPAPYLIVKTDRGHQYVTYDVDLLIEDSAQIANFLQAKNHPQGRLRKQINLIGDDLLTIDVHRGFFWQGSQYLDKDLVWKFPRRKSIQGIEVPIPSREIELTVNLAHFLFERRYLTILEFWYFYDEFRNDVDREFIYNQAKKYGWDKSLQLALSALETLSREFTGRRRLFSDKVLPRNNIYFPFFLTLNEGLSIFKEKYFKRKELPYYDLAYFLFAYSRYRLGGEKLLPYYREWVDFKKVKNEKG